MLGEAVPRIERQNIIGVNPAVRTVSLLGGKYNSGHTSIGALLLRPFHGDILDRHRFQVGTELNAYLVLRRIRWNVSTIS